MKGVLGVCSLLADNGTPFTRCIVVLPSLSDKDKFSLVQSYKGKEYYDLINSLSPNMYCCVDIPYNSKIPVIGKDTGVFCKIYKQKQADNLLKEYSPSWLINPRQLTGDIMYDAGWIMFRGMPVCSWTPKFGDLSGIKFDGNFISYAWQRELYLLLENYARHKRAVEEETLMINTHTGECKRGLSYCKNNLYISDMFVFDRTTFTWVRVNRMVNEPVLGYKQGKVISYG